jgi:8-oxo-dGTP pyrophosphatase MutT (NUDIX family)
VNVCDNRSAGVIIADGSGKYLLFDRATFPPGTAPVAGHVDDHGTYEDAAIAEVREETGLTVTRLHEVASGWRDNKCRRKPGPKGVGHEWRVYTATVTGTLKPSPRETKNARWLTADELQVLADQTARYAYGAHCDLGIEPVWCHWLAVAGLVSLPAADLAQVARIAAGR